MTELHVVWPAMVHDPARPSGGNVYDVELVRALRAAGAVVHEHLVPDGGRVSGLPTGAPVLLDGLVGLADPDAAAGTVLLVHLPLSLAAPDASTTEARALHTAAGVVATSGWTRDWLRRHHGVRAAVARPGVHRAPVARSSTGGTRLLCVGAVVPLKGQDLLVAALDGLDATCRFAGALDRDPTYAQELRRTGVGRWLGPLTREALARELAATDLLVLPTRLEAYGMVVTEALARGIPVVAGDVGGVREALVGAGVLVPPGDAGALRAALERWLGDADHRAEQRARALARRRTLLGWDVTARAVTAEVNQTARRSVVTA